MNEFKRKNIERNSGGNKITFSNVQNELHMQSVNARDRDKVGKLYIVYSKKYALSVWNRNKITKTITTKNWMKYYEKRDNYFKKR